MQAFAKAKKTKAYFKRYQVKYKRRRGKCPYFCQNIVLATLSAIMHHYGDEIGHFLMDLSVAENNSVFVELLVAFLVTLDLFICMLRNCSLMELLIYVLQSSSIFLFLS